MFIHAAIIHRSPSAGRASPPVPSGGRPKITIPVLYFRSKVDHVADISSSRAINAGLSSKDFEERILEDSYHVATLDNDAPRIFAESAEFIERVTSAGRG